MEYKIEEQENDIKIELLVQGKTVANATCYYKNTPKVNNKNIGCIGKFEANSIEYGVKILNKCEDVLKEQNVELIVAPMDGNTWKKYRTLKWSNGDKPFLLENVNSIEYNEILKKAGFEELHTYTSNKGLLEDAYNSKGLEYASQKLKEKNIILRKFNKNDYVEDLKKIYNISKVSFTRNPFYTPIEETEFIKQYEPYINMIDEDFILIAEQDRNEVGFIFCIPDLYNEKTLIVKTAAVLPEYEKLAIGNVLVRNIANVAIQKGFKEWIFAFMYENNTSQKSAKRNNAKVIREYAIYGKNISK